MFQYPIITLDCMIHLVQWPSWSCQGGLAVALRTTHGLYVECQDILYKSNFCLFNRWPHSFLCNPISSLCTQPFRLAPLDSAPTANQYLLHSSISFPSLLEHYSASHYAPSSEPQFHSPPPSNNILENRAFVVVPQLNPSLHSRCLPTLHPSSSL